MFEQMYDDYTKEKKYNFLLRFLGRTIDNYKETLKKTHFSGIHFSEASDEDIKLNSLRFNNLYSGVLEDISEIKMSQVAYEINVYMKYKEYNIDCLLFFRAVTDIDFRLHRLSFETDLLDFQIEAEYIAKKDMKKYSDLKNAISPLPLNFLEDDYYHQYFKWPNEFKKKLDEKPEDMEIVFYIVVITLEVL